MIFLLLGFSGFFFSVMFIHNVYDRKPMMQKKATKDANFL